MILDFDKVMVKQQKLSCGMDGSIAGEITIVFDENAIVDSSNPDVVLFTRIKPEALLENNK